MTQVDAREPAAGGRVVTREAIAAVEPLIRPYVRRTPVVAVNRADFGLPPGPLLLKLEQLQHSGSFKVRGAFANLLLRDVPAAGVVAASGGNHGVAVAYAAHVRGVPARIFVPTVSAPAKIARIRGYGADLVVTGATYADALAASQVWAANTDALVVHAFDQAETMLGAGTLGLELAEQASAVGGAGAADAAGWVDEVDGDGGDGGDVVAGGTGTVLIGVGGGGLLAGVAAWYAGRTRLIGVEPAGAPTLTWALAAGRPVDSPAGSIAVDSLAPRRIGRLTFPLLARFVSEVLLVSDDGIRRAQQALWETTRLVAEPGGCAALAAVLSGQYRPAPDETVAVVVSGANTAAVDFGR